MPRSRSILFPSLPAGSHWRQSSVAVEPQDNVCMINRPRTVRRSARNAAAAVSVRFVREVPDGWGDRRRVEWPEREHGSTSTRQSVGISGNNGFGTPPPRGNSDDMLLKFTKAGSQAAERPRRQSTAMRTTNRKQPADIAVSNRSTAFVADGTAICSRCRCGERHVKRAWGASGGTPSHRAQLKCP